MTVDLVSERDIQRALIGIARCMDNREWDELLSFLHPDLVADTGAEPCRSASEFIAMIRRFLDNCGPTQHLLGNIVIDVIGDNATSSAYVSDTHLSTDASDQREFRTLGNYFDTWKRVDGHWLLVSRTKVTRAYTGSTEVLRARKRT